MRTLENIILHHSASDIPNHDNIEIIRSWHVNERGWQDVGYHFYIQRSGLLQKGRDIDVTGSHCFGENSRSIGICLGGINNFTKAQFHTLAELIESLWVVFGNMDVAGHSDYDPVNKPNCPGFDVPHFLANHVLNKI